MILDTCFVIDLLEKNPEAIAKVVELQEKGEHQYITTITIFELWSALMRQQEKRRIKTKEIIGSQLILDLDKESAEIAGTIDGQLQKEGEMIQPEDCMIAGIALKNGESLLTRNLKHFKKVKGLAIVPY